MDLNDYVMYQNAWKRRKDQEQALQENALLAREGLTRDDLEAASNVSNMGGLLTGPAEPVTNTAPMDPMAHTRPAGVVYNQPDEDIQTSINEQLQKQILDEALSAEDWEKEKIRLIKEDNKLGMLVSLITGNSYKPLSFSNANARSSSARGAAAKKKETLEKATIDSRLIDNPPRGLDEVIEFGNSLNLSPTGWSYLKSRATMYHWGDEVSWMKLDENTGLVNTMYSRKGNKARNDQLRNLGYTAGDIGEQRNDAIANATRDVAEAYTPFIKGIWANSSKETFEEFENSDAFAALMKNPATLDALNQIRRDFTDKKPEEILMLNPQTGGLQRTANNTKNIMGMQEKGWIIPTPDDLKTKFSGDAKGATIASIAGSIFSEVQNITEPDVVKSVITEAVATNPDVIRNDYNIEEMTKKVSARLGVNSLAAQNEAFIAGEFARLSRDPDVTKKQLLDLVTGGVKRGEEFVTLDRAAQKEYTDIIDSRFKVPQWKNPIEATDTTTIYNQYDEPITISRNSLVTRDATGNLQTVKVLSRTSADGMRMYSPKLVDTGKTDEQGKRIVIPSGTQYVWDPTDKFVEDATSVLRANVTTLLEKPTEFNDAFSSYKSIVKSLTDLASFDNLDVGGVDRHIGTLIIKLRDTSMVTEGEFQALANSVGLWDAAKNSFKTFVEGHEFTPKQRSTMLLIATTWMEAKLERANEIRARNYEYLVHALRGSKYDTDMLPDSNVEPQMEAYIKGLEIRAGVPVDLLEGGEGENFIQNVQDIIRSDTTGKVFELITDLDTPSRRDITRTAVQEANDREEKVRKAIDDLQKKRSGPNRFGRQ